LSARCSRDPTKPTTVAHSLTNSASDIIDFAQFAGR